MYIKGGVHPEFFVKLDPETAADQRRRTRDGTFDGQLPPQNRVSQKIQGEAPETSLFVLLMVS